jgi:hypothetical protein
MPARINYIQHVNAFFAQVRKDDRLHANHISLYLALFQVWNQYRFHNPFPILREEVMQLSRIGSRSTYMRCLKQLHLYGYLLYQPAPQRYAPSLIQIHKLAAPATDTDATQLSLFQELKVGNLSLESANTWPKSGPYARPKNEPGTWPNTGPDTWLKNGPQRGPLLGHFNNKHINNKKRERENTPSPTKKNETKNKQKKQATTPPAAPAPAPAVPTLQQVQQFFQESHYPDQEARKFFHHYQANGWRQRSNMLITNWQAAAHKWMLNIHSPKNDAHDTNNTQRTTAQPGGLHTNQNKNYADPL